MGDVHFIRRRLIYSVDMYSYDEVILNIHIFVMDLILGLDLNYNYILCSFQSYFKVL